MEPGNVIIVDAAEYNAATNRISSALQLLRDEMKSLRHQDVTLMRQFINMNDKIRSISKEQRSQKNRARHQRNRTQCITSASLKSTTPSPQWPTLLVRQQSVPRYCDVIPEVRERRGSTSSDDESLDGESLSSSVTSLNDDFSDSTSSVTSDIPVFRPTTLLRQRSKSEVPLENTNSTDLNTNEAKYEDILQNNVNLWRTSLEESNDSVFDGDSSEERV